MFPIWVVWLTLIAPWIQTGLLSVAAEQTLSELRISEIMYNPPPFNGWEGRDLEYVELHNPGDGPLTLSGLRISDAIDYTFPAGAVLAQGDFLVIAASSDAFFAKYGFRPDGVFGGQLNNGGEVLRVEDAAGVPILVQPYGDDSGWPCGPDGGDFSLVLADPAAPALAASWRISTAAGGSPGNADPSPPVNPPAIVVSEVLAHTDEPAEDAIEFYNASAYDAHMGGWLLSDDADEPDRYVLPEGFYVPAGGYAVITEASFGQGEAGFRLSENGEEVVLTAADCRGETTGFRHIRAFDASPNGVSLGRHVTSTGDVHFPLQAAVTLGAANSAPFASPVVISEIMYHPAPDGPVADEYVEIRNTTAAPVPLYLPDFPWLTWKLDGVGDFALPANTILDPHQRLLIVGIEPALFRTRYAIPENVAIFGPYGGALDNGGERLALLRPEPPNPTGPQPYVVVDAVTYAERAPWPPQADGQGPALTRIDLRAYGDDPRNWRASNAEVDRVFLPIVR
jgi:hypothetical protein